MTGSTSRFLPALLLLSLAAGAGASEYHPSILEPFEVQATAADTNVVLIFDANKVGLTITNYGFVGTNFTSRSPSFEYPLGSAHQHMVRGGLWIGAISADDNGAFIGVTTAAVDGSQGNASAGATEFTADQSSISRRSTLPNSRYNSPGAVSELDFVSRFRDTPAKRALDNNEDHRPLHVNVTQYNYGWSFSNYAALRDLPLRHPQRRAAAARRLVRHVRRARERQHGPAESDPPLQLVLEEGAGLDRFAERAHRTLLPDEPRVSGQLPVRHLPRDRRRETARGQARGRARHVRQEGDVRGLELRAGEPRARRGRREVRDHVDGDADRDQFPATGQPGPDHRRPRHAARRGALSAHRQRRQRQRGLRLHRRSEPGRDHPACTDRPAGLRPRLPGAGAAALATAARGPARPHGGLLLGGLARVVPGSHEHDPAGLRGLSRVHRAEPRGPSPGRAVRQDHAAERHDRFQHRLLGRATRDARHVRRRDLPVQVHAGEPA